MKLFFYITSLLLALSASTQASIPIVLSDTNQSFQFKGLYLDYLEDSTNQLTFDDVRTKYHENFRSGSTDEIVINSNINATYWTRLTLTNKSKIRRNWVIELYDYKIDEYEVYIPNDTGGFDVFKNGANYFFNTKYFQHKNFIHDLYDLKNGPKTIYFKIKANKRVVFFGAVRTVQKLLEYSNLEYFLLSFFYGIVASMIIYNLFLYVSTLDIAYFYYVLYVTSIGILALTKDGIGFQYIWMEHPDWNEFIPLISSYSMICWVLIYTKTFLNTKSYLPLLDKGINFILIGRSVLFVCSFYNPIIAASSWLDILPIFYVYTVGIISWSYGYRMARFHVVAFTLFFAGYLITVLNDLQLIISHPLIVYGFNIGVLCEMLLLSLALADRIKILTLEKETAQREIIFQSQENEVLKDKINSDLEGKVQERTKELLQKNRELDSFVYRSSHDIKGPLKSIIGLTTVGLKDVQDLVAKNYFNHILKSSKRLDWVVDHLLKMMENKESKILISAVDFSGLIDDIFSSLENLPCFSVVQKKIIIDQPFQFYSDERIIYSVLQNLIENALKYHDPKKTSSTLTVHIIVDTSNSILKIIDNGLGIDENLQEKIFDMFYKVNPESSGSGLGLYMTKIYIEKLGGILTLKSEVGEGATFIIKLPNLPRNTLD